MLNFKPPVDEPEEPMDIGLALLNLLNRHKMATIRELAIRVTGDSTVYAREMNRASSVSTTFYRGQQERARRFDAYIRQNTYSVEAFNRNLSILGKTGATVIGGLIGGFAVSNVLKIADDYGQMAIRVKMALESATGSSAQFEKVQNRLFEMSNLNSRSLAQAQTLYIQTASGMKELGLSTDQTLGVISTLNNEFTINATNAQKTEGAINALTKAMMKGKVGSDELMSIMTAMPSLMIHIAANMGITEASLKNMVINNKISLNELLGEIAKLEQQTTGMAKRMPNTVADGFQQVTNSLGRYLGEVNETNQITATLSNGLGLLANNFESVANATIILTGVGLSRYLGGVTQSTYGSIMASIKRSQSLRVETLAEKERITSQLTAIATEKSNSLAAQKSLVSQLALAKTETQRISIRAQLRANTARLTSAINEETAATARLTAANKSLNLVSRAGSGLLGLMGGPVGLIATVGVLAASFIDFSGDANKATQSLVDMSLPIDELIRKYDELNATQKKAFKNQTKAKVSVDLSEVETGLKKVGDHIETALSHYITTPNGFTSYMTPENKASLIEWSKSTGLLLEQLEKGQISAYDFGEQFAKYNEVALSGIKVDEQRRVTIENLSAETIKSVGAISKSNEALKHIEDQAKQTSNSLTKLPELLQFPNIDNQIGNLSQQLDVYRIKTEGGAEASYILSGLQRAAGDEALKYADSLYKLALGQEITGQVTTETEGKLKSYLALLKESYASNPEKKKASDYDSVLTRLKDQIAATKQLTEYDRIHYEISRGKYKDLLPAQITELENTAKQLDLSKKIVEEKKKADEEREKRQKEFNDLVLSLRTAEQKSLDDIREKADLVAQVVKSEQERYAIMQKITEQSIVKAPSSAMSSYTGIGSDMINVATKDKELDDWYTSQIEKQNEFLNQKLINEQAYSENVTKIEDQYRKTKAQNESAMQMATLGVFSSMTGSIADMFKETAGESSLAYKTMFLASKAASIAQSIIATEVAAAEALKFGGGGIAGITMSNVVRGLGYASVGMIAAQTISGMAHDGIDNIPREGTWLLDKGERVVDARTNADLKDFIKSNRSGGNLTINIPVNISDSSVSEQDSQQLGKLIEQSVMSVIEKQQRPGGIFSKR